MRLDFSTLRYRHGTFPQDACSLVRLGISKRTDGAWLPQRWSNYGGRPDYHLETQWGLVDPLVEALYRTGRLSDDWRRVLVADRPTGVESITRYNPRQRFVDQVYFAHGEASDLLLTGKLVVECRSRTYSEVLGVDTPLFISVLQYGDGLIEALDLSWLGEPGDTWCVRTTAGELDTLLPRLAARCTAE